MNRRAEIDALRGLMLVLMTVTHLPVRHGEWLGQPFGFVSAAEGFVFLSAYLVGLIYTQRALAEGTGGMRRALWRRAFLVYACHVGMLLFLFTVITWIGVRSERPAITNLVAFYLEQPMTALWSGFALLYNPPLLDILPMYVLFMLASPLALSLGLRTGGWRLVAVVSFTVWLLAQFGLTQALYALAVRSTGLKVPLHATGAFELVAWQLLWIFGLWLGATQVTASAGASAAPRRFPGWLVAGALIVTLAGMAWRHHVGQAPFGANAELNLLFDKWQLGPLRLLNFLALLVVVMYFGPHLARVARFRFLEGLGAASLPVFCAHLVVALLALAALGDRRGETPFWVENLVLAGAFVVLYAVAWASQRASVQVAQKHRAPEAVAGVVQVKRV